MRNVATVAVVTSCALVMRAGTTIAQTPAEPITAPNFAGSTPAECTRRATEWRIAQLTAAMTALRTAKDPEESRAASAKYAALYGAASKESQRAARACAAAFNVDSISPAQLPDLAALYSFAGDTAKTRRATERALAAPNLSPRQRGQTLALAMAQEITARPSDYFGIIAGAERYLAQIDQLPDSLADIKLAAHQRMLGQYEYLDVDEGLRQHATAIIELGRRSGSSASLPGAFLSLARSAADYLHPDSALMILDAAEKELGTEKVGAMFKDFRNRYALIGKPAAAITGQYWLNAGGAPVPVQPGNGKVTFIEFTAHWCMPCKNSYPGVRSLAERFRGQAFEGVLVTSLYGYLGTRKNLTAEQEVDADRSYFTQEHELPFKVAVNPPPKTGRSQPAVDEAYRVGGIPQIVIVDKRGIIRQIVIGWDRGNTDRIGQIIEQLLNETGLSGSY
jgi:thiol-disulfide isomerase/thioredoxin